MEYRIKHSHGRMFMGKLRPISELAPGLSVGATTAALAIVLALTVVTTGAAHAQSFQVIYTFRRTGRGAVPMPA